MFGKLSGYDGDNGTEDFGGFRAGQTARCGKNDAFTGSEQLVWADKTVNRQCPGCEIVGGNRYGKRVVSAPAGNLADDKVIPRHIAPHKFAHASSSSGVFQSAASAASHNSMVSGGLSAGLNIRVIRPAGTSGGTSIVKRRLGGISTVMMFMSLIPVGLGTGYNTKNLDN
jgi:hypothetical protein